MTVADLIRELRTLPDDAKVLLVDDEMGALYPLSEVLYRHRNNTVEIV